MRLGKRSTLLDILVILFGISAWISINGLWVELPLLVQRLPEKWHLASYLSVIIQIANLGPLIYGLFRFCMGENPIRQRVAIYALLLMGSLSSLGLVFGWDITTYFGETEHSTMLFILVFALSLVDCTSSILFLPYMGYFKKIYLNSYLVGEGLSGFIPSIVALFQGVGGNPVCANVSTSDGKWEFTPLVPEPRFSVKSFFSFLSFLMIASLGAFTLINLIPNLKKERSVSAQGSIINRKKEAQNGTEELHFQFSNEDLSAAKSPIILLIIQAFVCFLSNGALPSIQTFSCLPYGNVVYHLSVTLNAMSNPLMAFIAFFIPCKSLKIIGILTIVGTGFSIVILAMALHSPDMLWGQNVGGTIAVFSWVIFGGLCSYVKVSIAGSCRNLSDSALFRCGAVTQIGSALGALLMFFVVNYLNIFEAYYVKCR